MLNNVHEALVKIASYILKVRSEDIDSYVELNEYGFDQVALSEFANHINHEFNLELTPASLLEHPTLNSLANYVAQRCGTSLVEYDDNVSQEPIQPLITNTPEHAREMETLILRHVTQRSFASRSACIMRKAAYIARHEFIRF